jgi:KaiC/GvpD/RAD55 family RecA-like ATPase
LPKIPLLEELTTGSIPRGSNLLVVFDPASAWYNAALTISVGWLQTGGRVHYNASVQSPDTVRSQLTRLGLNPENLEKEDSLRIYDWYSATLGRRSEEKQSIHSLKVQELSPEYAAWMKGDELGENVNTLRVVENASTLARYNDEKLFVEFVLTRVFPRSPLWKATLINPLVRGLHSDWLYKALESSADGVIDFKLDESHDPAQNLVRIRSLRNARFDGRWHTLQVAENLEVMMAT